MEQILDLFGYTAINLHKQFSMCRQDRVDCLPHRIRIDLAYVRDGIESMVIEVIAGKSGSLLQV